MSKTKVVGRVFGIIFISVIIIALLATMIFNLYQKFTYREFYGASDSAMLIPDLWSGITPQGFEYDSETDMYYMCGYMKDGGSSRIYAFSDKSDDFKYAKIVKKNGKPDDCHAGGLSMWKDFVFMATGEVVNIYSRSDLDTALSENGGTLAPIAVMDVPLVPAFCYVQDNFLYVGEFYIAEDYETDPTHHMTTTCGDEQKALMTVYELSADSPNGIKSEIPVKVYSICDNAQGVCITENGNICIITSCSLTKSHAYIYKDPSIGFIDRMYDVTIDGEKHEVPLYYLDSDHLRNDWVMPPMAEEPVYKDGKIYVMYESASNKYLYGKISGGIYVYSFPQE